LQACEFGVVGTIYLYKQFPTRLIAIKKQFAANLEWNTLPGKVANSILCLAWQDNNIVLALSNVYIVD
jgi:hypothetical protein